MAHLRIEPSTRTEIHQNRYAKSSYEIGKKFEAGISLVGTEIVSGVVVWCGAVWFIRERFTARSGSINSCIPLPSTTIHPFYRRRPS